MLLSKKADIVHALEEAVSSTQKSAAAIIVRPPEAISISCLVGGPSAPGGNQGGARGPRWVLFDSHKRPLHEGMALLEFATKASLLAYLDELFPQLEGFSDDFDAGAQLDMLGSVGAHLYPCSRLSLPFNSFHALI